MNIAKFATQVNNEDSRSYKMYIQEHVLRSIPGMVGLNCVLGNVVNVEVVKDGNMTFSEMEIKHHDSEGEPIEMLYKGVLEFDPSTVEFKFESTTSVPGMTPEGVILLIMSRKRFYQASYEFGVDYHFNRDEMKDLEYFSNVASRNGEFCDEDRDEALKFVCHIAKRLVKPSINKKEK